MKGYFIMQIHQILRSLREDNDKKQQDIANILEIKQQQYSVYENGKQEFPTRHIKIGRASCRERVLRCV